MTVTIQEAKIITGIVPKGEKPVKINDYTLNTGESFHRKDKTGRTCLKLVAAYDGGCFGELIRRDSKPETAHHIAVDKGQSESGLQFNTPKHKNDTEFNARYSIISIKVSE